MGKVVEINAETNEVIEREETAAEAADRAKLQAEYEAQIASEEAKATQRQAILDRLGLTAEEAALLLGGN